ncbi:MAG TPA: tetratricopeptide repeat protein [Candidatus Deferrimicrobiaceae bacterium]|nr:tetratricopeptide repeat protein [Candidatus Deferrimicrobiaceae bacterium]
MPSTRDHSAKRRRAVLAAVLVLDLCLANACLLAGGARPAVAQQSEADVFVAQAILAYDARKYDEALGLLKEALAQDPKNVEALYYSGLVLMAQQKTEQAVEALEKARALAPRDQSILFLLGVAYFALERYDQAEAPLTQVLNERPQTEGIGYYVGLIRYRKKDYQGALKAFRAETSKNPNIQQLVRFYSGLTLAILGLPEQAVAEVDAALRLQTGSALTGPAERIRDSLASAREAERRFHAEVRFGFLYDTNVPVVPQPSHDPTAEAIRRRKRATPGELAGLRLDYTWLRTGPWESTVTYSFFQTINNRSALSEFDVQNHLLAGALTYRAAIGAMPFQVGTQYSWDYLSLGGDDFLQRHTTTVFGTLVENQSNLTTVLARFQNKDFYATRGQLEDEDRDARNFMLGLTHVFRFAQDKHYIRVGYQFDYEKADGRNFTYAGNRFLAGGQYTLPWGSTRLRYDFDLHQRHYQHANTLLPVVNPGTREREDFEQNHVVRVEQVLARNLGPASIGCAPTAPCPLSLAAEYQRTVAESNLAVYGYNRNVWSLTLSWQY